MADGLAFRGLAYAASGANSSFSEGYHRDCFVFAQSSHTQAREVSGCIKTDETIEELRCLCAFHAQSVKDENIVQFRTTNVKQTWTSLPIPTSSCWFQKVKLIPSNAIRGPQLPLLQCVSTPTPENSRSLSSRQRCRSYPNVRQCSCPRIGRSLRLPSRPESSCRPSLVSPCNVLCRWAAPSCYRSSRSVRQRARQWYLVVEPRGTGRPMRMSLMLRCAR